MFAGARHPASGAIVLFSGDTRNHSRNREVLYLEYEAHEELAEKMIGEILNEAKRRWSLNSALCVHRLGRVDISESAVVVITSSAHRDAAYESNRFIIDRVKLTVPIWKNEFFADGSAIWSDPQR
jgi:molybdopterin synthase catalytic subunit